MPRASLWKQTPFGYAAGVILLSPIYWVQAGHQGDLPSCLRFVLPATLQGTKTAALVVEQYNAFVSGLGPVGETKLFPPLPESKGEVSSVNLRLAQHHAKEASQQGKPLETYMSEHRPDGTLLHTRGRILTSETLEKFPSGEQQDFIVLPDGTISVGAIHYNLGMGANLLSAGECKIIWEYSPSAPQIRVHEVQLNLKSGAYFIQDRNSGFFQMISALWARHIYPETIVLKDVESGGALNSQKVIVRLP